MPARSLAAAHREVKRAKVLLMAVDGVANAKIAAAVGATPVTAGSWRGRFADEGLSKFGQVRAGRGRKPGISAANLEEIVRLTQHEKPSGEAHWSSRSMAKAVGVSPATVQRIWSGRGLKPHLVKTFRLSGDPAFEEKLIDVVVLYLNPPDHGPTAYSSSTSVNRKIPMCFTTVITGLEAQMRVAPRQVRHWNRDGPGAQPKTRAPGCPLPPAFRTAVHVVPSRRQDRAARLSDRRDRHGR